MNGVEINQSKLMEKFRKIKPIKVIMTIIGLVIAFTGFYIVNPDEVGIIQRFGKYTDTTEPGLHFKIPLGIDKLTKVQVRRIFKEEFGFRTLEAGIKTKYSEQDFSDESLILTGDLNIADVEWVVQYRIKDPVLYLFNLRDVTQTLRNVAEAVMRLTVGNHSVDEVIVLDRKDIAFTSAQKMQEILDGYRVGIEVVTINLQNVNPPPPVQPAFNEVNEAKQEQERIMNEAWQKYNQTVPEARGTAKQTVEEANGYAIERVNKAKGDANRFSALLKEYKNAPEVTKKRLYIETMQEVLPKLDKVYIVDENQKNTLPLLNIMGKEGK